MDLPSFRDRLRMTWEMTWPLAAMDCAAAIAIHGLLEVQGETPDSIWAVIGFFVASPWVVGRALALSYGPRSAVAVSRDGKARTRLTYQQSLKIVWLLAWRSTLMALAAILALSALLHLAGITARNFPALGALGNALGLSAVDAITSLVFFPFLIPGMLRKRYRDFHLEWHSVRRATHGASR
ncbi:MAG TPA: hypothetical protein VH639_17440 [Bryobacteraceae bacterium]|jgi:hypothetical protein